MNVTGLNMPGNPQRNVMDYNKLKELRATLDKGLGAKKELGEMLETLTDEPPDTPICFTFSEDKWSHEYRTNFLLHFIEMKGLSQEADDLLSLFYKREDDE